MGLEDSKSNAVRVATILGSSPKLHSTVPDEDWDSHEEIRLYVLSVGALSATLASEDYTWIVTEIAFWSIAGLRYWDLNFGTFLTLPEKFFYLESA
ncbi:uncharacterized protein Z518_02257 [Rhinocladiella mackenziei CBS 650.93]|uniref:Uncharacterized protein n=1 Tax=Rhinocladiella mackenziei CBS 650.93 TaxID=1442369 RepID=A0A0D2IP39_9EURO|nr:uncharacterized protein Z518_02257 [Rhinocladiella mackenziei CBS 650.93]KIX07604.1 hypothetical protein Z518_02257 [Rhinocladiella mackenziei CBS 650.93]